MIGLVDLHWQQAADLVLPPPNLEIMKLAEYYKHEENIYCRIIGLDEVQFTGYDKIYIFSENDNYITVPDAFKQATNVIYGGSAFTNKKYVPFQNELIDYTLPKPNIYGRLLKEKYQAGTKEINIDHILEDSYYRRFAGEKELPIPPIMRQKRFYIYDRDFFQPGWQDVVEDISEHKPSSINFIHPLRLHKISDFIAVRTTDIISKSNEVFLDIYVPLNETKYMMKEYKNKFLELIMPNSQIFLSIGGSYQYQTEYYKNFIYKMNLLYTFWANKIPMKLKYEEPTLGCYDPLRELSQLVAGWTKSPLKEEQTIYERIPKKTKVPEKLAAKEQARILVDKYPQQDNLFKQTLTSIQKGGRWIK